MRRTLRPGGIDAVAVTGGRPTSLWVQDAGAASPVFAIGKRYENRMRWMSALALRTAGAGASISPAAGRERRNVP